MKHSHGITEERIEKGQPVTLESIENDLKNDYWNALYYATEEQICKLIEEGRISEDFFSRHQDYQEELRCIKAESLSEFGL